jgi:hypothetical protein
MTRYYRLDGESAGRVSQSLLVHCPVSCILYCSLGGRRLRESESESESEIESEREREGWRIENN